MFHKRRHQDSHLIILRRRKNHHRKSKKSLIFRIFEEYCMNSWMLGLRYMVDRERHWVERLWWIVAIVLSISLSVYFSYMMWTKWAENPVIISFDDRPQRVSTVPFPAVTLCPMAKTKSAFFNFTRIYRLISKLDGNKFHGPNQTELELMRVAAQVCNEWFGSDMRTKFDDNFTDNSILSTITKMAPTFKDTFANCELFNLPMNCMELIFPIFTEEGLCYSFNSMNINDILTDEVASELELVSTPRLSNWLQETGYDNPNCTRTYPYRFHQTFDAVNGKIFQCMLQVLNRDIDYLCGGAFDGYKVTFHLPNELPQIRRKYYHVRANQAMIFIVSPSVIVTSPTLRDYTPTVRQCYFTTERKLRFFRQYTQQNCEVECLANFTLKECECVHFAMLRSQETKVCGTRRIRCVMHAESNLFVSGEIDKCNCLPSCTTLSYRISTNILRYDHTAAINMINESTKQMLDNIHPNNTVGLVMLAFNKDNVDVSKRIEFLNLTDFLSNTGGLFGFFLGTSLLSFMEFIYFIVIRPLLSRH